MHKLTIVALTALIIAQGLLPRGALAGDAGKEKQVRVTATTLNVRSGPGTASPALTSVPKGTLLVLVKQEGDWMQVRLDDGTLGWAAAKFLAEVIASDQPQATPEETPAPEVPMPAEPAGIESERGGSSAFGAIVTWGSLIGAAALGGLAYNERTKGNDSYEEYKRLYNAGQRQDAETKYSETGDHDSKAKTYGIIAGGLLALFTVKQFILRDADGRDPADPGRASRVSVTWDPRTGQIRTVLILKRF